MLTRVNTCAIFSEDPKNQTVVHPQHPPNEMKKSVLVLGSPGITAVITSILSGAFNIETVQTSRGAFNTLQATTKLAGDPGIRKLVVVPDGDLCDGVCNLIKRAARLGKTTTVISANNSDTNRLREQSSAIGASFFEGSLDRETLLEMISAHAV